MAKENRRDNPVTVKSKIRHLPCLTACPRAKTALPSLPDFVVSVLDYTQSSVGFYIIVLQALLRPKSIQIGLYWHACVK